MTYRDDLAALSARHQALANEVASKTRELEQATQVLDEARAKARLPVLDNIRVASPCPAQWADMQGDDRVRHCGDCSKSVYNLSDMTRDEAEALIIAKEGKLCVRYFQRKDGTILLKDCSIGVSRRRRRKWVAASTAALLATGGAAIAMRLLDKTEKQEIHEIAGGLEPIDIRGEVAMPIDPPPSTHDVREVLGTPPPPEMIEHHEVKGEISIAPDHDRAPPQITPKKLRRR